MGDVANDLIGRVRVCITGNGGGPRKRERPGKATPSIDTVAGGGTRLEKEAW